MSIGEKLYVENYSIGKRVVYGVRGLGSESGVVGSIVSWKVEGFWGGEGFWGRF